MNYRLRFEVVGDRLRAQVNDVFVAEAHVRRRALRCRDEFSSGLL